MAIATATTRSTSAAKVAAASAVVFAVALFATVATVNVPREAGDAKLLDWWQQSSNQLSGMVSQYCAIVAAVSFVVLLNYFRTLTAGTSAVQWTAFARSMGLLFSMSLLVSGALRGVIGYQVKVDNEPLPGLDVLRYSTALNYNLIGNITMATLALTILAISIVTLRTAVLPKWSAYLGLATATVILLATAATFGAWTIPLALLWSLTFSAAILRTT